MIKTEEKRLGVGGWTKGAKRLEYTSGSQIKKPAESAKT